MSSLFAFSFLDVEPNRFLTFRIAGKWDLFRAQLEGPPGPPHQAPCGGAESPGVDLGDLGFCPSSAPRSSNKSLGPSEPQAPLL